MKILNLNGLAISAIAAELPEREVDNFAALAPVCGDEKARSIVKATGIATRRVAAEGETALDLCCRAAEKALPADRSSIGALVSVGFTGARMPPPSAQAVARLGLPSDIPAIDVHSACAGYPYGLYVAGLLAKENGRPTLLLDGDVQTPFTDPADPATLAVFADAGTATVVSPAPESKEPWRFAFLSDGSRGGALELSDGGKIRMDGFGVFRFVAQDVTGFLSSFIAEAGDYDVFVPHQANAYMIRELARSLGAEERLRVSCDRFGNSSSASVPVTIATADVRRPATLLLAGFGAGLSASAARVRF